VEREWKEESTIIHTISQTRRQGTEIIVQPNWTSWGMSQQKRGERLEQASHGPLESKHPDTLLCSETRSFVNFDSFNNYIYAISRLFVDQIIIVYSWVLGVNLMEK
jgi:hypothetical protein